MVHLKDIFNKGIYPYERQKEVIRAALKHKYCIIGAEMGCGKSLMSVAVACLSGGHTLCVVPSALKLNWDAEIKKYCDRTVTTISTGAEAQRLKIKTDFIIISYSLLHKLPPSELVKISNVIFDESHYLINVEAQRTEQAHQFIETYKPKRVMLLSGTPIKGRVTEFFSPVAMTHYGTDMFVYDMSGIIDSQHKWNETFSLKKLVKFGGRSTVVYRGLNRENLPLLRKILNGRFIRIQLKDIKEMPKMLEKSVFVEYDSSELAEAWEIANTKPAHAMAIKARVANAKAPFTADYVKLLVAEGNPVIVFTEHLEAANSLHKLLKGSKLITGAVNADERFRLVDKFQKGEYDILVATIGSASTGFTMTRSKNMVFNDQSFDEAANDQARRRIYRIGQEENVVIHNILGGVADERILKAIKSKVKEVREIYENQQRES